MHGHDLGRLRRFVVTRINLTWAELGCLVPSVEAAKRRFRRWAKRKGTFDRLMRCSQPLAVSDVLHIDGPAFVQRKRTSAKCCRTVTGAGGSGAESIWRSRGGLTTEAHYAVDGLDFIRRQSTSPRQ